MESPRAHGPSLSPPLHRVPGGSAANVSKCLAGLSAGAETPGLHPLSVSFVGMVGGDAGGEQYRRMLQAHGVHPALEESAAADKATATCLCLVTPDGQRTMRTYLGAAVDFQDLPESFAAAPGLRLAHFEGYCLYRARLAEAAMRAARTAGAQISLDLASFEIVRGCWDALEAILRAGLVDVVFCNEDEAAAVCEVAALTGGSSGGGGADPDAAVEAALTHLLQFSSVVVVSKGKRGCVAAAREAARVAAPAAGVQVVDTVGAGDFFSAGFLYAWLQDAPLQTCAQCGCAAGAAAVQAAGAELGLEATQALRGSIAALLARR